MNINQPTAEQLENMYPTRNMQDVMRQHHYANKTFYEINPEDPNQYRTYFYRVNVFANGRIDPMISNYLVGVPPDGMKPLDPKLHSAVMRNRNINAPF